MDEAFLRLRSYARSDNDKLTGVAEALVTLTLTAVEIDTLIGSGHRTQSDAAS